MSASSAGAANTASADREVLQVAQFERLETAPNATQGEGASTVRVPSAPDAPRTNPDASAGDAPVMPDAPAGPEVAPPDAPGAPEGDPADGEPNATDVEDLLSGLEGAPVRQVEDADGRAANASWSVRKGAGLVFMAGSVPSRTVLEDLVAVAGGGASNALIVAESEMPTGFARDAEAALAALALVPEGRAIFRNGTWSFSATLKDLADEEAVHAALETAATPSGSWILDLEAQEDTDPIEESQAGSEAVVAPDEVVESAQESESTLAQVPDQSADSPAIADSEDAPEPAEAESEIGEAPEMEQTEPAPARDGAPAPAIQEEQDQPAPSDTATTAQACKGAVEQTLGAQTLLFASGRSQMTAESEGLLPTLAEDLALCPQAKVYVEGHTDSVGNESRNLSLSVARAEAVVDGLVALGVSPRRLYAIGYGESLPRASNDTAEGRARNRRIVFRFSDPAQPVESQQ